MNILNLNKKALLKIVNDNTKVQPKAKYSNDIIIKIANKVMNDNDIITAEITRAKNGLMVNRGSVVECLVKIGIIHYMQPELEIIEMQKMDARQSDLNTTKMNKDKLEILSLPKSTNIEIKFSTSFANATQKQNKARFVILINQHKAQMLRAGYIDTDPKGHILPNQEFGRDLKNLTKLLGL